MIKKLALYMLTFLIFSALFLGYYNGKNSRVLFNGIPNYKSLDIEISEDNDKKIDDGRDKNVNGDFFIEEDSKEANTDNIGKTKEDLTKVEHKYEANKINNDNNSSNLEKNININSQCNENTITVKAKELKYSNDIVDIKINFPQIEGGIKKEILDKVNKDIEEYSMNFKNDIEKIAKEHSEDAKKLGYKINPYVGENDYNISYNCNNILSIPINYYQYTGGAHGMTYKVSFNYDLNTGDKIKLSSLFEPGFNYKEYINNVIMDTIKKNPDNYFKEEFKGIKDDQDFYVSKDGIVIYFQSYDIAPYATGIPEFIIK